MIRSQDVSTLQRLIDEIPCAIFILNSNGIFIECSKPCLNFFHLDNPDQIIGKSPEIISPPFQRNGKNSNEEIKKWILLARQNGSVTFNWDHKRLNGDIFPAKVTLSTSIYEGETCILATVIDNTGNVLEEEIEALINGNPYALIVSIQI